MKRTARIRTDDRYQWPLASRGCQFPPKVRGLRSGRTLKNRPEKVVLGDGRRRMSNRNPDWSMPQGTHDASPRDLARRAHTRMDHRLGDLGCSMPSHPPRHTPQGPSGTGPVSTTSGIGLSGRCIDSASSFPSPCARVLLKQCGVASMHEIRGAPRRATRAIIPVVRLTCNAPRQGSGSPLPSAVLVIRGPPRPPHASGTPDTRLVESECAVILQGLIYIST